MLKRFSKAKGWMQAIKAANSGAERASIEILEAHPNLGNRYEYWALLGVNKSRLDLFEEAISNFLAAKDIASAKYHGKKINRDEYNYVRKYIESALIYCGYDLIEFDLEAIVFDPSQVPRKVRRLFPMQVT